MARDITIIQGSETNIRVVQSNSSATDVTLYAKHDENGHTFSVTDSYSDGQAVLVIEGVDTGVLGVYSYQLNETIPTGYVKYGAFGCEDCDYGKLIICESLDGGIS